MLRHFIILTFTFIFILRCESQELRSHENSSPRPNEETTLPGYIVEEQNHELPAGETLSVKIGSTKVEVSPDSTNEDAMVRLRVLSEVPEREETIELGDAKGDVVEVTFYRKDSGEVFASNFLAKPYDFSQSLEGVLENDDLKYVVITSYGTDNEQIPVIGSTDIEIETLALISESLQVSLKLSLTSFIIYAVESSYIPPNITVSNGITISNSGGTVVTVSPNVPTNVDDGKNNDSTTQSPTINYQPET